MRLKVFGVEIVGTIGWALGKQPQFVPALGMRTIQQLDEALTAKPLIAEQLVEISDDRARGAIAGTGQRSRALRELAG